MNNPNIAALVKSEKSAQKRMRYLALLHFSDGHSRTAIVRMLKVSRTSVNRWIATYLAQGLRGLDDTPNPGRPATLSTAQHSKPSSKRSYSTKVYLNRGRLMAKDVGHFIQSEFGVTFKQANNYRLLHQLGFS